MSDLKITKMLVPSSKYSIKCPYSMKPVGIAIHETWNNAPAKNEVSYMISNANQVSFHYAVDDKQAVQGIPLNRNAYHAGDGRNGEGNRKYIAIEICYSKSGGSKYVKARKNAALLAAKLLKKHGWGVDKLRTHQSFSGKYCPHRMLDENYWNTFKLMVKKNLDAMNKPAFEEYQVRIIASSLYIRKTPAWGDADVAGKITDKGVYTIVEEKMLDNTKFGKLKSGAGWISLASKYVQKA
jgi:N-acetylmuramoyl-L-alanine amidase CwlA